MPDRKYWDLRKWQYTTVLSDLIECPRCGSHRFTFRKQIDSLIGDNGRQFVQTCMSCRNVSFVADTVTYEDRKRYVPMDVWERTGPEKRDLLARKWRRVVEDSPKDKVVPSNGVVKGSIAKCAFCGKEFIAKRNGQKYCSQHCSGKAVLVKKKVS